MSDSAPDVKWLREWRDTLGGEDRAWLDIRCEDADKWMAIVRWALTHGRPPFCRRCLDDTPRHSAACKRWRELQDAVGVRDDR